MAEAAKLLAASGEAKLLAGGHTLLPTMKLRLANPKVIVDLSRVAELERHRQEGQRSRDRRDGDATTRSPPRGRAGAIAGLAELAGGIGDQHVRNRGTIGGSVANNDPAADYPAALLALNATIVTNKREIKADDYFKGLFATALDDGEIITRISLPGAGASSPTSSSPTPPRATRWSASPWRRPARTRAWR